MKNSALISFYVTFLITFFKRDKKKENDVVKITNHFLSKPGLKDHPLRVIGTSLPSASAPCKEE